MWVCEREREKERVCVCVCECGVALKSGWVGAPGREKRRAPRA